MSQTRRRVLLGAVGVGLGSAVGIVAARLLRGDANEPRPASTGANETPGWMERGEGPAKEFPTDLVSIFGAPGTFGGLTDSTVVVPVDVPGWGFGPGQAAFMSAVAADGTVFIATTPFSDDQSKLTGTNMELGVFESVAGRFTRLVIPSSSGTTSQPRADPAYRGVGGGDVGDVVVATGPDGDERAVFVSAMPYYGWDLTVHGLLPSFGQLRHVDGQWRYDQALSRTADQLAATTEPYVAATAFPIYQPGEPRSSRGLASIVRLPHSQHFVIAQYLGTGGAGTDSGALLVVDIDGNVKAYWQYPQVKPLGITVIVNPREVVADPTSEPDDERFVLISDCRGLDYQPLPFTVQEFSYSASQGAITPKSTAVRAVQDYSRMETAVFDANGTLFVARTRADGLRADKMAVYPKLGPERGLVTRTPATGNWPVDSWGTTNSPDFLVTGTDQGGLVRSFLVDPSSGAVLLTGLDGLLQVVRPSGAGTRMTFQTSRPLDIGLNKLRGPSSRYVGIRRGAVDAERRILWLPVNQMVLDDLPWPYPPFKLDQWLLRVDLDKLLAT